MDKSLWISWYDLSQENVDEHLAWVHETYIPKILKRPGVLWSAHYRSAQLPKAHRITWTSDPAVPDATQYILITGGESTHVFTKEARWFASHERGESSAHTSTREANAFAAGQPGAWEASLSSEDRRMLAMRKGERIAIMSEEARIDGPEASQRGGRALGPCIQLGSYNANSIELEEELLAWYADWRFPAMAKLPGCIGMRKMVSTVGWAKHAVLYEFLSLEARAAGVAQVPRLYPEMEAWTNRFIPHLVHTAGSPNVATRIWPE